MLFLLATPVARRRRHLDPFVDVDGRIFLVQWWGVGPVGRQEEQDRYHL